MRRKSLCIVDTSSLINSYQIELGRKSLDKWLWDEFDIKYSKTVLEEFQTGSSNRSPKRKWEDHIWSLPSIPTHERILFQSLQREIEYLCGRCSCTRIVCRNEPFTVDLNDVRDKGERHNCCIALEAIRTKQYPQIIFLTDDFKAVRDYAKNFFDTFPLGTTWSLLDFIIYLFMRYYNRITIDDVENALRDANAISSSSSEAESEKKVQRLNIYFKKANRIAGALFQISGGHQ